MQPVTDPVFAPPGRRWSLYAIEAIATGTLVAAAGIYTLAVQHPASPVRMLLPDALSRRATIGVAMAVTIATIAYSPWGRRSGAHCNPALTLTFFGLRKVAAGDVFGYVAAQFAGALLGALAIAAVWRVALAHPAVHWYVTVPGRLGTSAAFIAEAAVAATLMATVLTTMRSARWRRWTAVCAALIVALAIAFESPISGTGLNPARSFATAAISGIWNALWIYFTAPLLGMLVAARIARGAVPCAKLVHDDVDRPCHFIGCTIARAALPAERIDRAPLLLDGGRS
jgi:aquaporin Z